ncbi:MAG: hypothetical protein ACRDPL_20300, partial [Propionibacteriaceae bacterium]
FIWELLAHRAAYPPPSSSLAEEERLRSLLLRAARAIPDARSSALLQVDFGRPVHLSPCRQEDTP